MKKDIPKLSIIIVNYNVKDFLEQALISLKRATKAIASEVLIVDNASFDGSVQMLKQRFPDVIRIENTRNIGFSAANNQAIKKAHGEYIVLLNPDTVVQEDTFTKLLEFFDDHPEASAATCKILNPDGTFSVDCRHSIPSPSTAFWKLIGLNRLFPKNRVFGKYNLTYLDENTTNMVEGISGSFMMIRKEVVEKVGLLDERFFMYCEDIDYCHRINQVGGKIYYVPSSRIIHYKGESTKKDNIDYIITFNKSLYLFYRKHYKQKYVFLFEWLILLGVIFRGTMVFFKNILKQYYPFLLDLSILNLLMLISFYIRYELRGGFTINAFLSKYIIVNIITSFVYFIASLSFDTLNKYRFFVSKVIKATIMSFTLVSAFTFFFKQFAFSRMVVIVTAFSSIVIMTFWRLALNYYSRKSATFLGKELFLKRTLIVGFDDETKHLLNMLEHRPRSGIDIVGVVALDSSHIGKTLSSFPVVSSLDQLQEYINSRKIDLVVFSTHRLSFERILNTMASVQNPNIEYKMVPGHLEFMVGKSDVERLDRLPLLEIEYAYGKPINSFIKRSFDIVFSSITLIPLLPFFLFCLPFCSKKIQRKTVGISRDRRFNQTVFWYEKPGIFRFILNLIDILLGKLSIVGAPIDSNLVSEILHDSKPGITGIIQVNKHPGMNQEEMESLAAYYLKNQNFLMDIEIIFKSIFK